MTFLEALKSERPMRRKALMTTTQWIMLGYEGPNPVLGTACWRECTTGKRIGLRRADYQASDWEIMP